MRMLRVIGAGFSNKAVILTILSKPPIAHSLSSRIAAKPACALEKLDGRRLTPGNDGRSAFGSGRDLRLLASALAAASPDRS
jgi:hypothetical protein